MASVISCDFWDCNGWLFCHRRLAELKVSVCLKRSRLNVCCHAPGQSFPKDIHGVALCLYIKMMKVVVWRSLASLSHLCDRCLNWVRLLDCLFWKVTKFVKGSHLLILLSQRGFQTMSAKPTRTYSEAYRGFSVHGKLRLSKGVFFRFL